MYPLPLLQSTMEIRPLLGERAGEPHVFDFSSKNPRTCEYDTAHFEAFQNIVVDELARNGKTWGIGKYLEERAGVLRHYPQMIAEKRIYHAGLDVTGGAGTPLFCPIPATVHLVGKEEGLGNYGGYVMLAHAMDGTRFYSFYGHLDSKHRVKVGQVLNSGEVFAAIGDGRDSGGWFTHTHLQIVTEEAERQGRVFQGYVSAADLPMIELLFPNPYLLFRW
ncbi:peptidoglycan DD-metalloendopeptidase family protein [Candidatus Peregrinibacteria bacterium]|nr:peptidoglycan DD-metalloendopeptidase family protein [Candidatus Peregrinibacteria bacterium]